MTTFNFTKSHKNGVIVIKNRKKNEAKNEKINAWPIKSTTPSNVLR